MNPYTRNCQPHMIRARHSQLSLARFLSVLEGIGNAPAHFKSLQCRFLFFLLAFIGLIRRIIVCAIRRIIVRLIAGRLTLNGLAFAVLAFAACFSRSSSIRQGASGSVVNLLLRSAGFRIVPGNPAFRLAFAGFTCLELHVSSLPFCCSLAFRFSIV